jgi:predicted transcriptional regulator
VPEWSQRFEVKGVAMTAKEKVKALVDALPEDASFEDILKELAYEQMVNKGLSDSRAGRVISNEEMKKRIQKWRK